MVSLSNGISIQPAHASYLPKKQAFRLEFCPPAVLNSLVWYAKCAATYRRRFEHSKIAFFFTFDPVFSCFPLRFPFPPLLKKMYARYSLTASCYNRNRVSSSRLFSSLVLERYVRNHSLAHALACYYIHLPLRYSHIRAL